MEGGSAVPRLDAIYARQSVERVDSISVESQIEACRREIMEGAAELYIDRGYSGKNTDRPSFQRLLQDIRAGKIRRVFVYRLDRISRSVLDFAQIIDVFQAHEVDFVSTVEKFDTGTPIGKAMLMIVMIFAQLERETIQQRVADAYQSRSRHGFYMGGRVPYGFVLQEITLHGKRTKRYQAVPDEAEVVQAVFSFYAKPQTSLEDVARWLEQNQVRKRDGTCFTRSRIRDMIINPIYVRADWQLYEFCKKHQITCVNPPEDFIGVHGAYLYSSKTEETRKTLDLAGHTLVLAPHEGIVDADIWIRCREKCLKNVSAFKRVRPRRNWLAGKLICAECGRTLAIKNYPRKTMADRRCYVCGKPGGGCLPSMDADGIDRIVLEALQKKLPFLHQPPLEKSMETAMEEIRLRERMERLAQEQNLLLEKIPLADRVVMEYINRQAGALEQERSLLLQEVQKIAKRQEEQPPLAYWQIWERLPVAEKHAVCDAMLEHILVSPQKLSFYWRF